MAKRKTTRAASEKWLIGPCSSADRTFGICERKLPTKLEVLRNFYANLRSSPGTVSATEAAGETASQLLGIWESASVPTREKRSVVQQILLLYKKYRSLEKNKGLSKRKKGDGVGRTFEKNKADFSNSLHKLFDIGHKNAFKLMEVQEDKDFYKSMQEDRQMKITGPDHIYNTKKKLAAREAAKKMFEAKYEAVNDKYLLARQISGLSDTSASTGVGGSSAEDTDGEFLVQSRRSKKLKVNVLKDRLVTSSLARTSTSAAAGTMMVKAIVQAAVSELGIDKQEVQIIASKTHMQRNSAKNLEEVSTIIKNEFTTEHSLVVHFDGKLFPSIEDETVKADRLPVVVSGKDTEKLLGVPELKHGSGECIATAVVSLLKEWELEEKVVGMAFDRTSTNSGRWGGACVLIQQKLGKELLELACRHHVLELLLGAVFDAAVGSSKTPELLFVDTLKLKWKEIDKGKYRTAASCRGHLQQIPNPEDVIKFCSVKLKEQQPRDDYRELLELTILFLGGSIPHQRNYQFRKPGATSKTRWMAKALYSFKIWMFAKQLKLSASQGTKFFKVCVFIAGFYVKCWFECPVAVKAPANDLALLLSLADRKEPYLKAAYAKLANHLWYLSEKLVCLALFDERVSKDEKRNIVASVRTSDGSFDNSPRAALPLNKPISSLCLCDFASKNSINFFNITKISPKFLDKDPVDWPTDPDYQLGLDTVRHLVPVNDIAKRGVSLIKTYLNGNKLTHDEGQRQHMLQVVERHRSMFDKHGKEKQN